MIATLVMAALLQTVGPTAADSPTPLVTPASLSRTAPAKDEKVCRTMIPLGSHVGHGECMLKSEWAAYDREVERRRARNSDMGGGQGACLPNEPCRN